jgi:hypothetical protein
MPALGAGIILAHNATLVGELYKAAKPNRIFDSRTEKNTDKIYPTHAGITIYMELKSVFLSVRESYDTSTWVRYHSRA